MTEQTREELDKIHKDPNTIYYNPPLNGGSHAIARPEAEREEFFTPYRNFFFNAGAPDFVQIIVSPDMDLINNVLLAKNGRKWYSQEYVAFLESQLMNAADAGKELDKVFQQLQEKIPPRAFPNRENDNEGHQG